MWMSKVYYETTRMELHIMVIVDVKSLLETRN